MLLHRSYVTSGRIQIEMYRSSLVQTSIELLVDTNWRQPKGNQYKWDANLGVLRCPDDFEYLTEVQPCVLLRNFLDHLLRILDKILRHPDWNGNVFFLYLLQGAP
jgi:hypothetical protein